jgi:hypothetical protein
MTLREAGEISRPDISGMGPLQLDCHSRLYFRFAIFTELPA